MLAGVQQALVGCGAITQAELPELLHAAGVTGVRVADQPMPTRFVMLADKTGLTVIRNRVQPQLSDVCEVDGSTDSSALDPVVLRCEPRAQQVDGVDHLARIRVGLLFDDVPAVADSERGGPDP